MTKNTKTVIGLLLVVLVIVAIPLFMLKGAEFTGSDDAGSVVVSEVTGSEYVPWATPVMETLIGGPLPSEMQSLFFCVQTGIGVGIFAFLMGRFVERKKREDEKDMKKEEIIKKS